MITDKGQMIMSNSTNSSRRRYQVIRELGNNCVGGRITYLATDTTTGQAVVIKQFQFSQSGSSWSGFKAHEREIQVIRSLNHLGIPRYLNSFETSKGFCIVQEYKDAQSLAVPRSFEPSQIKQIAISVLEILVYLQNQTPPIIHRDIKPENILVDEQLNVYLVDFGLARIGGSEGVMSSFAAGTFGFMALEQIYNRQLNEATDLYGLGATLICLVSGIKSTDIGKLIDEDSRIAFKHLVPQLNPCFIDWLQRMVQPDQKERYPSAAAAKAALQPINVDSIPEVQLNHSSLQFKATQPSQKLTQTLHIKNSPSVPVREGNWEVAPHPNDPPPTPNTHARISLAPVRFVGNIKNLLSDFFNRLRTQSRLSGLSPQSEVNQQQIYKPTEKEITLALTHRGTPTWTEEDFQKLLYTLGCAGYGWLQPEGVRKQLEAMKENRQLLQSHSGTSRGKSIKKLQSQDKSRRGSSRGSGK